MPAIESLVGAVLDFGDLLSRRKQRVAALAAVAVVMVASPDTVVRAAQARAKPVIEALLSSLPGP